MKLTQTLFLAIKTIIAVSFMNDSISTGDALIAGIYAYIGYRNLRFAYKVTKFIQLVEKQSKK